MVECMVMSKSKEYEYLHQPLHKLMSESPDPDVKSKLRSRRKGL